MGAAILLVGLVDELVGLTSFDVWQWLVAAGLAVAVGLHHLASTLEGRACRTVRVLTAIAAIGASLYLAADVPEAIPLAGVAVLATLLGVLGTRTGNVVRGGTGGA